MRLVPVLIVFAAVCGVVVARSDKASVRAALESETDFVLYGPEISKTALEDGEIALSVESYKAGGSATVAFLEDELKELVTNSTLGSDAVHKLVIKAAILKGELNGFQGVITGGVLTYHDNEGFTCNCCLWSCNSPINIPCSGCSCKECGQTQFSTPTTLQPYISFLSDSPPNTNLAVDHDSLRSASDDIGCDSIKLARFPVCVAAIHRRCLELGYFAGLSQEFPSGEYVTSGCFQPDLYERISHDHLRKQHSLKCRLEQSQNLDCTSAVSRYCSKDKGFDGGFAQEVINNDFEVACVNFDWIGDVPMLELREHDKSCERAQKSHSNACTSAIHRWCAERGYNFGVVQDYAKNGIKVGCKNVPWYGHIPLYKDASK